MFDDRYVRAQEDGVHGARAACCVINVERVNAHERSSRLAQPFRGVRRKKRMTFKIFVRSPVLRPTGANQYGFAANIDLRELLGADGPLSGIGSNDYPVEIGDGFER